MSDREELAIPIKPKFSIRRNAVYAAVLLFVFLLGLIPMWLKARDNARKLTEAEHQITLLKLQNNLASAVISSRRGDYEPARQTASQFFTTLRSEIDKGSESSLTQAQKDSVESLFAGRDDIITLLARGDPAASDRLSDLYVLYRKIMNI